ncbi:MAG: hypothetical protein U0903_10275 [Planctomycetales bacterium]
MFADLLETAVQVADVRDRINDRLALDLEQQAKRRVLRGRVLRTEVQGRYSCSIG